MTEEIRGTGLTPFCAIGRLHFYSPSAAVSAPPKKCGESGDFTLELSRLEIAAEEARGLNGFYFGTAEFRCLGC